MAGRSPAFQAAWDKSLTLAAQPTNDEKLDMYAYGKIADKKPFSEAQKPGMFDISGKAKYNRWEQFVNRGMSSAEAEKLYSELVDELVAKYGTK